MIESFDDLKARMGWAVIRGITSGESLSSITQTQFDMVTLWHNERRKQEAESRKKRHQQNAAQGGGEHG